MWNERLLLEDEQEIEIDDDEVAEMQQKYSRRQLGTNADRYVEPEPELDDDGELRRHLCAKHFTDLLFCGAHRRSNCRA